MSKTIKELADSMGVSKTYIRKFMTDDFRLHYTETSANGVITITSAGCRIIALSMGKMPVSDVCGTPETPETKSSQDDSDVIALLRATVDTLQHQLEVKDQQIAALTEALSATLQSTAVSLQAAQALHAGTIQQRITDGSPEPGKPAPSRHWWQFGRK